MILSVEPRSVQRPKRNDMEVNSISPIANTWEKDYTVQSVAKAPDSRYKVTNTIYTVITYDQNGKLDTSTNTRYLDYIV
jgi:hypothetical protein